MKIGVIFILFIFCFSFISAVEINSKESFSKGENFIAEISGNFIDPPLKENIFFYRDHIRTPIDYNLIRLGDSYYLYAYLPLVEGNYSFEIEDVLYKEGTKSVDEDIKYQFIIINETIPFVVKPGMIYKNKDFDIEVTNFMNSKIIVNINSPKNIISYDFSATKNSFEIKSGDTKKIYFDTSDSDSLIDNLGISSTDYSYEIPLYFISNKSSINENDLKFDPREMKLMLSTNSTYERFVILKNNGDEVSDIEFKVSNSLKNILKLELNNLDSLGKNSSLRLGFNLFNLTEGYTEGYISAEYNNTNIYHYLYLNITKDFVPDNEEVECSSIGGVICGENSECKSSEEIVNGVRCCLDICIEKETEPPKNNSKLFGWGLLILLLIFLAWFFLKKYKGTKNEVNFLKFKKK